MTLSKERLEAKLSYCERYHHAHQAPISVKELREVIRELLALRKERERAQPMFYVDGNAAKHLLRGYTRFATMTVEPKPGLSLPLYIAPPPAQPVAVPDVKPSFKAMMLALDAFYADEDVPEVAMLVAYKILRDDCRAAMLKGADDAAS